MSIEWLKWYIAQTDKQKNWPKYKERYLCPCCYMPTLEERASYQICAICNWEDDGQDSDDANVVRGGPNFDYSLAEARENFRTSHTMYRISDSDSFQREQGSELLRKSVYSAFSKALISGADDDWISALNEEASYYKIR